MSWREILGVAIQPTTFHTQNTHNTQNHAQSPNSAECAFSAEGEIELTMALAAVTEDLPIDHKDVRNALTPQDVHAWSAGHVPVETLAAFASAMVTRREIEQGICPAHYVHRATCVQCGPVWLWFAGEVLGCPWCWNRVRGLPFPHP